MYICLYRYINICLKKSYVLNIQMTSAAIGGQNYQIIYSYLYIYIYIYIYIYGGPTFCSRKGKVIAEVNQEITSPRRSHNHLN